MKKKRVEAAGCSQTIEKIKEVCSQTDTTKPSDSFETNSGAMDVEQVKDAPKISDEMPQKQKVRYIDWRTLPWSQDNIELIESDHINIDVFTKGLMKNVERLGRLNPGYWNTFGREGSTGNERHRRYPRRNVPRVSYEEEDVSSDDDYIYCDECGRPYDGSCPEHGPLVFVEDKKATAGAKFAWNTCPDYLSVCRSGIRGAGLGIWTEIDLIKGFVFGPYKGKIIKSRSEAEKSGYSWEIRRNGKILHFIEGSDTSISNWMRFVNCAMCEERQNLIAFQYRGQIYYRIYKDIKACTELLVWYGDEFGKELGIYWNEDRLLMEGKNKSCQLKKNLAPSSSSIRQHDGSQTCSQQTKKVFLDRVLSRSTNSDTIPSLPEGCKMLKYSKFRKGELQRILKATDPIDKSTFDIKNKIKCVGKESVISGIRSNFIGIGETKKAKPHTCPHCDYKTAYITDLRKHVDAVHERKRPFKCEQCDYRASVATNLRMHVRAVHEGLKPFKCRHCDYEATRSTNLQKHVNAVHERLKPYPCPKCDYRASVVGNLLQHIAAVHEGERPHPCPHCNYRAARAVHLRDHVNGVHEKKKPYSCPHCDYKATRSSDLREHVKRIHSGQKDRELSKV